MSEYYNYATSTVNKITSTKDHNKNDVFAAVDQERKQEVINEFFATSITEDTNRLLSEDYHFCKIAREAGFRVWAAPWAQLSHTGTYVFNGHLPSAE